MRKKKIYGEYALVSNLTRDWTRLNEVHSIAISKKEALDIIRDLCHYLDIAIPTVTFRNGKGVAYKSQNKIGLPHTDVSSRRPLLNGWERYGVLRVGLVLHELAHLITPTTYHRSSGYRKNHGKEFVARLDYLVAKWYELLEKKNDAYRKSICK